MGTTNRLFYSSTKFFTENEEEYRITATVSLHNHYQIYGRDIQDVMGGVTGGAGVYG